MMPCPKLLKALMACFVMVFLTSAGYAVRSHFFEDCDGFFMKVYIDGVAAYHMDCRGSCTLDDCTKKDEWEPRLHEECRCGTSVPSWMCKAEHWLSDPGTIFEWDNVVCKKTGCWTLCAKLAPSEVPEAPDYVRVCRCPSPPIDD